MQTVYIVEDDANIRQLIIYALTSSGYEAEGFESGREFFDALDHRVPGMVLLDIMLPDLNGVEILRRLRSGAKTASLPVMMLTAKGAEYDKVNALDAGADDYMTKPFGVMEMISRVKALFRRAGGQAPAEEVLELGPIRMDLSRRTVTAGGEEVSLTYKEFELLHYLLKNAGLVLSRDRIMQVVWGFDFQGESRTVDMHVKLLRQKLGVAGDLIRTVRGVGYKLEDTGVK